MFVSRIYLYMEVDNEIHSIYKVWATIIHGLCNFNTKQLMILLLDQIHKNHLLKNYRMVLNMIAYFIEQ